MRLHLFAGLLLALLLADSTQAQSPDQWQQAVAYEMDIHLKADRHRVHGHQRLTYTNNAPDTLHTVYYHLYFNAFHPNSMMAERNRHLPDPDGRIVPRIFNLDEDEQGWHKIQSLTQDGTPVDWTVRETVMRVDLAEPIPPGASTTFEMDFRSQVPLQTRRSGRDSRGDRIDYTMTQWYPKMAEYDERGWHADPYVNREFYAPYGTFDVKITLPSEYTIGATGQLQNPAEIGHGYDIDGSGTWQPSDGLPEADSLTWHFRAENVHDFAWSADPDYIHDKVVADGTTHHILYKPEVAEQWRPLKNDMPRLTRFFNENYGDYPYPQMTVAQGGDGGMEYPMFTVVSSYNRPNFETKSSRQSVLGTTIHEFAHMWYYGALGTNESDYSWMDEGFTTYTSSEGFAHLTGSSANHSPLGYIRLQKLGLAEPLSTPADWFTTNTAFGVTSYSTGAFLIDMMGYVIGEDQRNQWLKRYLRKRTFQHPDPFDLELFAEQVSGLKLDWYFWQFTRTTRELDDAITNLDQQPSGGGYEVDLTLERKGEAVMPPDIRLTLADGSTQWVNVPLLIMHGHKPVSDDWIVTDPWPWTHPEKTFTFTVPARVESAELDPEGRTPDVNRLNNTGSFPVHTRALHPPEQSWFDYGIGYRPLLQYAHDFGFGAGVQLRGQYFLGDHQLRGMVKFWPEVLFSGGDEPSIAPMFDYTASRPDPQDHLIPSETSAFDGIDYELSYKRRVQTLGPRATVELSARKHLGLMENTLTVEKPLGPPISALTAGPEQRITAQILHQYNPTDRVFGAFESPLEFRSGPGLPTDVVDTRTNLFGQAHLLSAQLQYRVEDDDDWLAVNLEAGGSLKDTGFLFFSPGRPAPSATQFAVSAGKTIPFGAFEGQAAFQFGLAPDNLASHKLFRLGSPSLESLWRNDTFRSIAASFANPVDDAHFVGMNPTGPVAYLRAFPNLSTVASPAGSHLIEGRITLHAPQPQNSAVLAPFRFGVFSGIGSVWSDGAFLAGFDSDDLLADAGFGVSYDVSAIDALQRWTAQSDVLSGLQLTAKFPIWASDPERIDRDQSEFEFRWLIGVEVGL